MQYPKEIKSQTIARYKSKESVISISNETGIPRSTVYRWLNESKNLNARWKSCKPCWLLFVNLEFRSTHH